METRDLDRIRFVTRHFHDLQGLRYLVPVGLVTLSVGGATYPTNPVLPLLETVVVLAALLLMSSASRYYGSTFGEVERPPARPAVELSSLSIFSPAGSTRQLARSRQAIPAGEERFLIILGLTLAAIVAFQILFWPPWITLNSVVIFDPSASFVPMSSAGKAFSTQLIYALYGTFFLASWLLRERRLAQTYHLALGILLLGLSVQPVVAPLGLALLLCGSSMVLAGLLDHWQLVRALGWPVPSREEEDR